MGARHSGREAALQILFAIDATGQSASEAIARFWRCFEADPEGKAYADRVTESVAASLDRIDDTIRTASTKWRLERMPRVDRNVLRLATWELLQRAETPRAVILDEAIELAKTFGTEDSGAFVNGVLHRIAEDLGVK